MVERPLAEVVATSPTLQLRSRVAGLVFGEQGQLVARADWAMWNSQALLSRQVAAASTEAALGAAEAVAASGWLPVATLPATTSRETLYMFAQTQEGTKGTTFPGVAWDNVAGVSDLINRYMTGVLPPNEILANLIRSRDAFIRAKEDPKIIRRMSDVIGRLSMDYKHHWDEG